MATAAGLEATVRRTRGRSGPVRLGQRSAAESPESSYHFDGPDRSAPAGYGSDAGFHGVLQNLVHQLWPTRVAPPLYGAFLGRFAVYRFGSVIDLGRVRQTLELAMYLIARSGRPVAREELVELLWPNADPQVAIHRLHVSASALRHALDERDASESAVQYHAEAYQIPAEFALTDCTLFDGFTREARRYIEKQDFPAAATSFRTALDLYQGDYLADQQYTEWTSQARAHYVELRLQALTFLCQHAIQTQQLPLVADYAREILEVDNLRERAHRDLMPVHYQLGQKACAIRQYQACAAILRTELDVTPSRLTTQLYQAICQDSELPVEMSLFSTTLNQGAVSRA